MKSATLTERNRWLDEVGALLSVQAAREKCEALGLLVLLSYMPLHHTSDPESLGPLSDLIASFAQGSLPGGGDDCFRESPPSSSALYQLLAGRDSPRVLAVFTALAPLLAPLAQQDAQPAVAAWEQRAQQLATVALMAAMHGEKEYCQLHACPVLARTPSVNGRLGELTSSLLSKGREAQLANVQSGGCALGALILTWCVVVLEVGADDGIADLASELAVTGEALQGLAWGMDLLRTSGFRHDDPPEELSSIARQLLFDLTAGMLSQPRYRAQVAHASDATHAADMGWPAHAEHLILLMAAVLEGRPALCRTFWSDPDFLVDGSLSSMLLNARYPFNAELLPTLLAALCADADTAARAWGFAHSLHRVCHRLPTHSIGGVVCQADDLFTEARTHHPLRRPRATYTHMTRT